MMYSIKCILGDKLMDVQGFKTYDNDPVCRYLEIGDILSSRSNTEWTVISYDSNLNLYIVMHKRSVGYIVSYNNILYLAGNEYKLFCSLETAKRISRLQENKQQLSIKLLDRIPDDLNRIIISYYFV